MEGEVVRETPQAVTLRSSAGTFEIPRDRIAAIERKAYVPPSRPVEPPEAPAPSAAPKAAETQQEEPERAEPPDRAVLEARLNTALQDFDSLSDNQDAAVAADDLVSLGRDIVPLIVERLPGLEAPRQRWLVEVLGRIGDPRGAPACLDLLASPKGEVRGNAAKALGILQEKRAIQPLIGLLASDGDWTVKREVCRALRALQAQEAVGALIARLSDVSLFVRSEAQEALKGITGEDLGGNPDAWLAGHPMGIREDKPYLRSAPRE